MEVAAYIVEQLIRYGVTDTFGVPGGVILKLIYAMKAREPEICPHLCYHEQMAGFAACGYAQASKRLGVAYATRGPGITNMITCMAEAYQESLPVLFITAHQARQKCDGMRFENNQELDLTECVSGFTKFASSVEEKEDVLPMMEKACREALSGRCGPVFLDFSTYLFAEEIFENFSTIAFSPKIQNTVNSSSECNVAIKTIQQKMNECECPVILIGDGLRQVKDKLLLQRVFESLGIPILSSRASQDILSQLELYYGYIGSHGTRYSNFILAKADLIISVGNRLAFPLNSESYSLIFKDTSLIRLDIDEREFKREIPNANNFHVDIREFVQCLDDRHITFSSKSGWIEKCNIIKDNLYDIDITCPVEHIMTYLGKEKNSRVYVCDVGNNEFWFARAFERLHPQGELLYSKSFGTLGVALGRAIGAYYATRKIVVCIIGDQGFQYNIQELEYIAYCNLPIEIVLMNNTSSGMILDHEKKMGENKYLHVTEATGYGTPNFKNIVESYNIKFLTTNQIDKLPPPPFVYEIRYCADYGLVPYLPKGNVCQDMKPVINRNLYTYLDNL